MNADLLLCQRCDARYDVDDNYCRACGSSLRAGVPALRDEAAFATTVWEPRVPSVVVKGAAVVAAGTVARVVLRGLVNYALGSRKSRTKRGQTLTGPVQANVIEDARLISETLIVRRVRVDR